MTVSLTPEKKHKLKRACQQVLQQDVITVRQFTEVIGILVASFLPVQYGKLFYRRSDNLKTYILKKNGGDFYAQGIILQECREDLNWWIRGHRDSKTNGCHS